MRIALLFSEAPSGERVFDDLPTPNVPELQRTNRNWDIKRLHE